MNSTYESQEKWSFLPKVIVEDWKVGQIGELSVYLVHSTAQLLYRCRATALVLLEGLDQTFALFVCEHSPGGLAQVKVVEYFLIGSKKTQKWKQLLTKIDIFYYTT